MLVSTIYLLYAVTIFYSEIDVVTMLRFKNVGTNSKHLIFQTQDITICKKLNAIFERKSSTHIYCFCGDKQLFYLKDRYGVPKCYDQNKLGMFL